MPVRGFALAVVVVCITMPLGAQGQVLDRIRGAGVVRIGFREAAVPFSFATADGAAHGYSLDLCRAIVPHLAAPGAAPLRIEYRRVTPASRLEQVVQGGIDLECGSTTITEERRARVAFSPVIFVSGTRLLVKRGNPVHSLQGLAGKTLVSVAGTTNARAVMGQASGRIRDLRLRTATGYDEAVTMLDIGEADALAADDVLLYGLLSRPGMRDRFIVVGERLTREPYGIAYRRGDAALARAVEAAFAQLATSGELRRIYERWFLQPLPNGATLGVPMSADLQEQFRALGLAVQ